MWGVCSFIASGLYTYKACLLCGVVLCCLALLSTFCMYGLVCVAFLPPKVYHMWCEVVCDFCSYAYTCVVVVVCVVFVCICIELDVLFAAFAWGL